MGNLLRRWSGATAVNELAYRGVLRLLRQRLTQLPLILLMLSLLFFFLVYALPGDVALLLLPPNASFGDRQALLHQLGMDTPFLQQYFNWLLQVCRGNWGYSVVFQQPVGPLVFERLRITMTLAVLAFLLGSCFAILIGIVSSLQQEKLLGYLINFLLIVAISTPAFFLGTLLLWGLAFSRGWFPLTGISADGFAKLSWSVKLSHLALPLLAVAVLHGARYARHVCAHLTASLLHPSILFMRSRGFSRLRIIAHAFNNSAPALVALLGLSFTQLLSGSLITETVFAIPGMGRLLYQSVAQRDGPVLIGATMIFTLLTLAVTLITDVMHLLLVPGSCNNDDR